MDETPFYLKPSFREGCLIYLSICFLIILPVVLYLVGWKMRFKVDLSAAVIFIAYPFSFLARIVIWSFEIDGKKDDLDVLLELLISVKAGFIAATLYYFVLEMEPVRIILDSLSF